MTTAMFDDEALKQHLIDNFAEMPDEGLVKWLVIPDHRTLHGAPAPWVKDLVQVVLTQRRHAELEIEYCDTPGCKCLWVCVTCADCGCAMGRTMDGYLVGSGVVQKVTPRELLARFAERKCAS